MTSISINHIIMPAKSSINVLSDICAICRENIADKCVKCLTNNLNNLCYSVLGVCNHAYHLCCINGRNKDYSFQQCPMCNKKWELKKRHTQKNNLVDKNKSSTITNTSINLSDHSDNENSNNNNSDDDNSDDDNSNNDNLNNLNQSSHPNLIFPPHVHLPWSSLPIQQSLFSDTDFSSPIQQSSDVDLSLPIQQSPDVGPSSPIQQSQFSDTGLLSPIQQSQFSDTGLLSPIQQLPSVVSSSPIQQLPYYPPYHDTFDNWIENTM